MGYVLKINGVSHRVTFRGNEKIYDPPLPETDGRFQDMLDSQSPPGCMTDDVFLSGIGSLEDQIPDERQRNELIKAARKRGYNPKPTDFYNSALADGRGDPAAFLNHGQGLGHVKRVAEERGIEVESGGGSSISKAREPEVDPYEKPRHKLNPKIVKRIARERASKDPEGTAKMHPRDLIDDIVHKHGKQD